MLQQVLHGMISNTFKMMRGITTIVLYTYILSIFSIPSFHLSIKHPFLLSFMFILISLSNNVIIHYNSTVYSFPSFYISPFYLKLTSSFLPFIIFLAYTPSSPLLTYASLPYLPTPRPPSAPIPPPPPHPTLSTRNWGVILPVSYM